MELPSRDDDPQARPRDGCGLHEHRQAGERHSAHRRPDPPRDRGRRRAARGREPHHVALVGDGRRDALLRLPVRKVSFTGSTEVGKELIRLSAGPGQAALARARRPRALHHLRRRAARGRVDGFIASKFRNAGQTCVCALHFVHRQPCASARAADHSIPLPPPSLEAALRWRSPVRRSLTWAAVGGGG